MDGTRNSETEAHPATLQSILEDKDEKVVRENADENPLAVQVVTRVTDFEDKDDFGTLLAKAIERKREKATRRELRSILFDALRVLDAEDAI